VRLVCIGASTGGPQTLQNILSGLPSNFPHPILCVQHISHGFLRGLVEWLNNSSRLRVKIAENGERVQGGTVYFPPENHHLEISPGGQLRTTSGPPVDGHRPSVTATFQSAARSYGSSVLTILLTGMGSDGALGMHSAVAAGGLTIAQDETSCVVYGMPRQAVELGAAQFVLSPDEIRQSLLQIQA
jgi:two-component system chemotaxis response regulator CheB